MWRKKHQESGSIDMLKLIYLFVFFFNFKCIASFNGKELRNKISLLLLTCFSLRKINIVSTEDIFSIRGFYKVLHKEFFMHPFIQLHSNYTGTVRKGRLPAIGKSVETFSGTWNKVAPEMIHECVY